MRRIMPLMKVMVCGSRTFTDYRLLRRTLDRLTFWADAVHLIHGNAKGADILAERWAFERYHSVSRFHPDWDTYGKSAGIRRNEEMLGTTPDLVVVVWNRGSIEANYFVRRAKELGLRLKVIRYLETT